MALPLLVLRPEPGNGASVERARAAGLDPVALPLFAIEPVAWSVPAIEGVDALLLTSANAIRHAGAGLGALGALPVWCVGPATAAAARAAGLDVVRTGTAGVDALLADAPSLPARLLWLTGDPRHDPAPIAGLTLTAITVYRARALPVDARRLAGPAVAMLHSARAAARLAALAPDRSTIAIVAISTAVALAAGDGWAEVAIAPTPDEGAMVALAAALCQKARAT